MKITKMNYIKRKSEKMTRFELIVLFGRFNYIFDFNKEGLTIITGPNGYGKSTILKCIEALTQNYTGIFFFYHLDFKSLRIRFDNDEDIIVEKNKKAILINNVEFPIDKINEMNINTLRKPYMSRIDSERWVDRRTNEIYSYPELVERRQLSMNYDNDWKSSEMDEHTIKMYKSIFIKNRRLIGSIYFVREQRLIKENKNKVEQNTVNVIDDLPKKFVLLINKISADYSTISNKLDSTYPNRLFSNEEEIDEEEYKKVMDEMTKKFEKLNKYDLSTMQISTNVIFKKEHAKALKIYFDDFKQKYNVYEDLIDKLELFTDIINDRLSFKKIKISREKGIVVVDSDNPKNILKLSQLSSGEKQEIVLFYDLIFEVNNNDLLLIDEPEISLHITWQKKFMDDLLKIINYKGIKVIVATHSPQIINNHWERQIDLGELYALQLDKK